MVQWAMASFSALSIIAVIGAGVGALYRIESHLNIYTLVLLAALLIDLLWYLIFIIYGTTCTTEPINYVQHVYTARTTCSGMVGAPVLIGMAALVLFKVVGLIIVLRSAAAIRGAYNRELIPHLAQSLANSIAAVKSPAQAFMPMAQAPPVQQVPVFQSWAAPVAQGSLAAVPRQVSYGSAPCVPATTVPASQVLRPRSMPSVTTAPRFV